MRDNLLTEEGGGCGEGAISYDGEKAWSSINHSRYMPQDVNFIPAASPSIKLHIPTPCKMLIFATGSSEPQKNVKNTFVYATVFGIKNHISFILSVPLGLPIISSINNK
jgi:hypothetical protein